MSPATVMSMHVGSSLRVRALLAGAFTLMVLSAPALAQHTERVSSDFTNAQGNGRSAGASMSEKGQYVAYWSHSDDLVAFDKNGKADIFVKNRATGEIVRVSVGPNGAEANGDSKDPEISADGHTVTFTSKADNLVPGDTNGEWDIFVHNLITGVTTRVSVGPNGAQSNGRSYAPSISGNGEKVVFVSSANDLVPGDTNGKPDVFAHNLITGVTIRVSVGLNGAQANGTSAAPSFSADCRYVVYESLATDLVPGDTNGVRDIFLYDLHTGETTRVSGGPNGVQANGSSGAAKISAAGRYIIYKSRATNLVPGDTNGFRDIFRYDRVLGTTSRVSVGPNGVQANGDSNDPAISSDGRQVLYESKASDLVPHDNNGCWDIFKTDCETGETKRVSVDSSGAEVHDDSYDPAFGQGPAISGDGRFSCFRGYSDSLVEGDTNGESDIFVHGPHLTLGAVPDTVGPGDRIDITTYTGLPGGLVFLVLVDINGTPFFKLLLRGKFDKAGIRTISGTVPPGLSGNVMTFQSLGFAPNFKAAISNEEAITFK